MTPHLTTTDEAKRLARSRWDQALRAWLLRGTPRLQVQIRGGGAAEKEILPDLARYRDWLRSWEAEPNVIWRTVRKGGLGEVRVPTEVLPPDLESFATWAGLHPELDRIRSRLDRLDLFGCDRALLVPVRADLIEMTEEEFGHLLRLIDWRRGTTEVVPPRNIPLNGTDTKWVENRIALIEPVLTSCGLTREGETRHERCGFFREGKTQLALRFAPGDFPVLDFTCDPESLVTWPPSVHTLIVLENLTTFRDVTPRPGYAIGWGSGHAAEASLPALPVADRIRILYWGDCDSHGYAILNGVRADLPHVRSVGMGLGTVVAHEDALVPEPPSARLFGEMTRLTMEERRGRDLLLTRELRLEQERVTLKEADLFPPPEYP